MQPDSQMPAALLLLPLKPLLRLIPFALSLLPVLLRRPPIAARLSPLALPLPPYVPHLPPFALRPLAFLATLSNHPRPRHRPTQRRAPGMAGPTRSQSSRPITPQTPPKSAPRPPKSFLEKTLSAREAPKVARFSRSRQQPSSGSARRLLPARWEGTGCAVEAAQPRPLADRPWRPAPNHAFPRPELDRLRGRSCPAPDVSRPPVAANGEPGSPSPGVGTARGRSCPAPDVSRPPAAAVVPFLGQNLESVIT